MRTTLWKYNITVAEQEDIQEAFDLINRTMPVKINDEYFSWLSECSAPLLPQVFIVKEDDNTIPAAVIGYPRNIKIDSIPIMSPFVGQLCTDSKKSVGKRGAGLELLLKTERYYLENQNAWLLHGLIGEELYTRFHRKMLGIGKANLNTVCFHLLDLEEYLQKFCAIVKNMTILMNVSMIIKMTTLLNDTYFLTIDNNGCNYSNCLSSKRFHLHLKGNIWPLFRVVIDKEGKGSLIRLLVSGQVRISGLIINFPKILGLFKLIKKVYNRKNEQ